MPLFPLYSSKSYSMHVSYFQYKLDILGNIMQVLWVLDTFLLDFVIMISALLVFCLFFGGEYE